MWMEEDSGMALVRLSLPQFVTTELSSFPFGFRARRFSEVSSSKLMARCAPETACKVIDSHLHVWASPQEAAEKYPYFPGQEPTLPGHADFLLQFVISESQHLDSVLKQLEDLITKDGYRAVRFNPYLWPSGQLMTNNTGKAMFAKAGELGVPVGFMCMKGLNLHISEIEELCTEFPSTRVLIDHLGFCKPVTNHDEEEVFLKLLNLSKFPQVYIKFSALFRVSRSPYPYQDLSDMLSKVVTSYGADRVMWGSDFPFVVSECGYKEAKEAACRLIQQAQLSPSDMDWIMGRTVDHVFGSQWSS